MSVQLPEPGEEGEHLTHISLRGDLTYPGLSKQGQLSTWPRRGNAVQGADMSSAEPPYKGLGELHLLFERYLKSSLPVLLQSIIQQITTGCPIPGNAMCKTEFIHPNPPREHQADAAKPREAQRQHRSCRLPGPGTQTLGPCLGFSLPLSCQASESCSKNMVLEREQVCPAKLSKHSTRKQERRARL